MTRTPPALTALALNCTLTPSPGESSTQLLTDQVLDALGGLGVADATPEKVASTTATVAANAAHLAGVLREAAYPPAS